MARAKSVRWCWRRDWESLNRVSCNTNQRECVHQNPTESNLMPVQNWCAEFRKWYVVVCTKCHVLQNLAGSVGTVSVFSPERRTNLRSNFLSTRMWYPIQISSKHGTSRKHQVLVIGYEKLRSVMYAYHLLLFGKCSFSR